MRPDNEIETQLHAIRAEVSAMADMMSAFVQDKVHGLGATAEAAADEATVRARKALGQWQHSIGQAEKALDHRVQEHPLQSILMAFGLGVLVSMLIWR